MESLTRGALKQSLLYILAFIITFAAPFAFLFSPGIITSARGDVILWLNSILLPAYGIFLILIYTRPKVQILSKMFPKASWFLCFRVVLSSGGEVPPAHELKPSRLLQMSEEESPVNDNVNNNVAGAEPPYDSNFALSMSEDVSYEDMKCSMMAVPRSECWIIESDDNNDSSPNAVNTI